MLNPGMVDGRTHTINGMTPVIAPLPGGTPAQLGGHRILGVLGAGGMGTVYLARRRGRPVALKTIRPELFRDADLRERFTREASAAAAVRSPFVANVLGSSTTGQVPWIAAEFVPGATLAAAVQRHGPLPATAVRVLAGALGRALTALAAAGVVHRDLKPSNVILGADRPRVVDFGIARVTGDATLTATGQRPGTPGYMSPEQVVKGPLGPPSDTRSSRAPGTPPAPLWSVPSPFTATTAVPSDEVLIHTSDILCGISTADGRILWETRTAMVDVAVAGDKLVGFVFDDDGNASAGYLDPRTGHLAADAANPAVLGDLTHTTQLLAADAECLYLKAYFRSGDRQQQEQAWLLAYELGARKLRWRTRVEGAVLDRDGSLMMSAIISGGRLICSDPARVFAVDLRDGRVLWACRVRTDQEATSADESGGINPPVASDRHVFDFEERITAVDLVTGAVAWKLEPESPKLLSAPVCVNGTVYAADGALQAFDELTGKKVWTHDPGAYVSMLAPPAPFRGELYAAVGGAGQAVVAVDVAARRVAWTLAAGAVNMPDGPTMIVQRGNRLYPQTADRLAAVPLD